MKSTKLTVLAALIGTCGFAAAQETTAPDRPKREIPAELVKKYDKDGDGKLSDEELKTMQDERKALDEKRKAEMLKKYDKDGDGKLSDEERKTMREDMEAKHKAILAKYDTDKDGKLSEDERKAAIAAGEEIPFGRGFGGGPGGRRGPGGKGGGPEGKGPEGAPPAPPTPPAGQ